MILRARREDAHHNEHDQAIFADVVKAALERGIDVPKIIADILRKESPKVSREDAHQEEP